MLLIPPLPLEIRYKLSQVIDSIHRLNPLHQIINITDYKPQNHYPKESTAISFQTNATQLFQKMWDQIL